MNSNFFWISYVTLWVLVIVLLIAMILMYQYIGQVFARTGRGRLEQGPDLGSRAPRTSGRLLDGSEYWVSAENGRPCLIYFIAAGCKPCEAVLPQLTAFATSVAIQTDTVVVCEGSETAVAKAAANLAGVRVVIDRRGNIRRQFAIYTPPFAVALGPDGRVHAKGSARTVEQMATLFERQEAQRAKSETPGHSDQPSLVAG